MLNIYLIYRGVFTKSQKVNQLSTGLAIRVSDFKGVLYLLPEKAPKLACFVLYLKIINIFLKNNNASYSKLSKEL